MPTEFLVEFFGSSLFLCLRNLQALFTRNGVNDRTVFVNVSIRFGRKDASQSVGSFLSFLNDSFQLGLCNFPSNLQINGCRRYQRRKNGR